MGGIARWAQLYQQHANAAGLTVQVVSNSPGQAKGDAESRFRFSRAAVAGKIVSKTAAALRQFKPDVLHIATSLVWATPRDALGLALARAAGVPSLLHIRGSNQTIAWHRELRGPVQVLVNKTLQMADMLIVLSVELENYLVAAVPGVQVVRVPNMVDLPLGQQARLPHPTVTGNNRAFRLLFVGWRIAAKGLVELAQAVAATPGVVLVCAMAGASSQAADQAESLDEAMATLRQLGRLEEHTDVPVSEMPALYASCDGFALPSWQEGLPNVLLEAMAAGLPCIVTPVGAIPDVVGPHSALVVPVRDLAALTVAVGRVAADAELCHTLGLAGRLRVEQTYTPATVMAAYKALYQQLLDTPRRS
jgi:glycosyltransferase involved in cell wall biosynthesis